MRTHCFLEDFGQEMTQIREDKIEHQQHDEPENHTKTCLKIKSVRHSFKELLEKIRSNHNNMMNQKPTRKRVRKNQLITFLGQEDDDIRTPERR